VQHQELVAVGHLDRADRHAARQHLGRDLADGQRPAVGPAQAQPDVVAAVADDVVGGDEPRRGRAELADVGPSVRSTFQRPE
jgi:hypothetical protein